MSILYSVPLPEVVAEGCGYSADYTDTISREGCSYAQGKLSTLSGNVPVRTGRLASSAFISCTSNDIFVGFSVSYAQYVSQADLIADIVSQDIETFVSARAFYYSRIAEIEVETICLELEDDAFAIRRLRYYHALRRRIRKRIRSRRTVWSRRRYSSDDDESKEPTFGRFAPRTAARLFKKYVTPSNLKSLLPSVLKFSIQGAVVLGALGPIGVIIGVIIAAASHFDSEEKSNRSNRLLF